MRILNAEMQPQAQGYLGRIAFELEGHKQAYELTLQSDKYLDDWNYALNFLSESGSEEQIAEVEQRIEEDDELFDALVDAAVSTLDRQA